MIPWLGCYWKIHYLVSIILWCWAYCVWWVWRGYLFIPSLTLTRFTEPDNYFPLLTSSQWIWHIWEHIFTNNVRETLLFCQWISVIPGMRQVTKKFPDFVIKWLCWENLRKCKIIKLLPTFDGGAAAAVKIHLGIFICQHPFLTHHQISLKLSRVSFLFFTAKLKLWISFDLKVLAQ